MRFYFILMCIIGDSSTMKSLLFISLIIAAQALSDISIWNEFKSKHGKHYNGSEEELRFNVFLKTLHKIESHNARYDKGEESYFLSINKFADWTEEEIKKLLNPENIDKLPKTRLIKQTTSESISDLPASVDWREKGIVSDVKDQLKVLCSAGWAFSAVGALEGQVAIKGGQLTNLSPQELIDCSSNHGNKGCNGGYSSWAFYYIKETGLSSEDQYPYLAADGVCQVVNYTRFVSPIQGHVELSYTEDALQEAVANVGPVAVGLYLTENTLFYGGGIFDDENCGEYPNHDVLAVGYASEDDQDYWLLKNSFGDYWGENGYIRLIRGKNRCAITGNINSYPVL